MLKNGHRFWSVERQRFINVDAPFLLWDVEKPELCRQVKESINRAKRTSGCGQLVDNLTHREREAMEEQIALVYT
jgi:hypothetical protein